MQFAARLFALSAFISQALALVALTNSVWDLTEGKPFEITWVDANGPVTLLLKDGPSSNLATVATIATGLTGNSYSWTPTNIPSGTYAVQISDSVDTNYGSQFSYFGTALATSTTETTTASTLTSATTASTGTSSDSSTVTTASTTSTGTSTASSTTATSTRSSATSGTTSSSTSTSTPLDTNASQKMGSPLALVLLTFAAVILCH